MQADNFNKLLYMRLHKLIVPVACLMLTGNVSNAQIMPWENRTEADEYATASNEKVATPGKLYLEDVLFGRLIQTKGVGSMNWMKDGERYSRLEQNKEEGGMDVVAYRAKDNAREVIIPSPYS